MFPQSAVCNRNHDQFVHSSFSVPQHRVLARYRHSRSSSTQRRTSCGKLHALIINYITTGFYMRAASHESAGSLHMVHRSMIADGNMHIDLVSWGASSTAPCCPERNGQHVHVLQQQHLPERDIAMTPRSARLGNSLSLHKQVLSAFPTTRVRLIYRRQSGQPDNSTVALVLAVTRGKQG
jgi:hypothetical protein